MYRTWEHFLHIWAISAASRVFQRHDSWIKPALWTATITGRESSHGVWGIPFRRFSLVNALMLQLICSEILRYRYIQKALSGSFRHEDRIRGERHFINLSAELQMDVMEGSQIAVRAPWGLCRKQNCSSRRSLIDTRLWQSQYAVTT